MPNRRCFLALAAAVAAAFSTPAFALGGLVDLTLVDRREGEPLATYTHRGTTWAAGRPGDRYAVRLSNRFGARVLVVLSVDGVNAVSGETAATGQTGYVLGPWQTTEITGWRKSLSEVAAFYFTALPDAYAARTDRPDNVGVIGAAVFRERELPLRRPAEADTRVAPGAAESERADRASPSAPAPSAKLAEREERLGTGHGERERAPTVQTRFERASEQPAELVRLRYDSAANLRAAGVIPRPRRGAATPEPFPGFVPDPPG